MKYEKPIIEITELELTDVITESFTVDIGDGPIINGGWSE